uniref:Uncharacterized protein LOC114342343 n=1 Tax=Diabrotica virgifera virgifera TaxID=50390 RepID=A0A6P7GGP2_DIAVI
MNFNSVKTTFHLPPEAIEKSCGSSNSCSTLPPEVIEWQWQDQISYWKAKAVSLQMENQMLKQHLRRVYTTLIDEPHDYRSRDMSTSHLPDQNFEKEVLFSRTNMIDHKNISKEVIPNLPDPEMKNRLEELRKMYGDKAEKIMGMETSLQLNYERCLEKDSPVYWPNIPIKLSFE